MERIHTGVCLAQWSPFAQHQLRYLIGRFLYVQVSFAISCVIYFLFFFSSDDQKAFENILNINQLNFLNNIYAKINKLARVIIAMFILIYISQIN